MGPAHFARKTFIHTKESVIMPNVLIPIACTVQLILRDLAVFAKTGSLLALNQVIVYHVLTKTVKNA